MKRLIPKKLKCLYCESDDIEHEEISHRARYNKKIESYYIPGDIGICCNNCTADYIINIFSVQTKLVSVYYKGVKFITGIIEN